jgi:hypothetical protein
MWMVRYHHFKKTSYKKFFIKKVINLEFHKTDFGVLKFKNLLLKPKLNWLNQMFFLNFLTFI